MPATRQLLSRSSIVRTVTCSRIIEPATWGPLLSGQPAGNYGFHHFEEFDPATMGTRFRQEIELEPLWLHLPSRGEGTLTLDLPDCHPHPRSAAAECCCWHRPDPPHRPMFTDARLAKRLRALGRPPRITTHPEALGLELEQQLGARLEQSARFRTRTIQTLGVARPLTCIGVHELHSAVHGLGHHGPDRHWFAAERRDPTMLARPYEAIDELIAAVTRQAGTANLVLVLARGGRPANHAGQLVEGLLERAGLLTRLIDGGAGGGASAGETAPVAERLRAMVPDARRERIAMRVLPVRLQHRMASQRFHDRYAWERTRVFPVPSWSEGYLRMNIAGREAAGIVPAEETGALLDHVSALVSEMVDADTGRPLVNEVIRARERFPGSDSTRFPDLIVTWSGSRPARVARHPRLGSWERPPRPNLWTEHRGEAEVIFAGPRVHPGLELEGDELGLAPTILLLMGQKAPRAMGGEVWSDVVSSHPER